MKKRGFTLVELLIVIIIIGTLASAMLLLMGTAEDKAEATSILSDMRSMKSVMVIFKLEKGHWPDLDDAADAAEVKKMLGGAKTDEFTLVSSGDLYAYLTFDLTAHSSGVRKKLRLMAPSSGLLKVGTAVGTAAPYEDGDSVEMKVR